MLTLIIGSLSISYILYVWFKTETFIEYITLLNLNKYNFLYSEDYLKYISALNVAADSNRINITYLQFLQIKHNNFFVRLMSCPFCVSFWLSLFISILSFSFISFLATAYLGSFFYFILLITVKLSRQEILKPKVPLEKIEVEVEYQPLAKTSLYNLLLERAKELQKQEEEER